MLWEQVSEFQGFKDGERLDKRRVGVLRLCDGKFLAQRVDLAIKQA
jgi:hypothetical protein